MRDSVQLALGWPDKSVPLERYWRNNPFVFSLVPRCHRFGLANVRREVRNKLERTGAMERSGTNFVFPTLNLARDPFLSRTRAWKVPTELEDSPFPRPASDLLGLLWTHAKRIARDTQIWLLGL